MIWHDLVTLSLASSAKWILDILGYLGISWDILGYLGISWDILGYLGISWDILGYLGISCISSKCWIFWISIYSFTHYQDPINPMGERLWLGLAQESGHDWEGEVPSEVELDDMRWTYRDERWGWSVDYSLIIHNLHVDIVWYCILIHWW